ncbi:oligosaccharide flippase family protein [Vibrio sp. Isolate25]|uniref:lipopolysaccharide biosynthesis protein n=1 Tax=Vibrio sp. Isolate25 TaxID=2908535 RepID=UPI001EFCCF46|nr:oligosaccharide flippase family protein [Vibrio sp. Isolate25]MCG9597823.1 oligosaccharide flippase family protein [Vibrio sp. Isolate25]
MKYNFKNIISFLLVNLFPQLSGFILLKLYTEHLGVDDFGVYNALMSIPPLLTVFASLQLHSSIGRFYFDFTESKEREKLIGTILSLVVLCSITFVFITFLFRSELNVLLFSGKLDNYDIELVIVLLTSLFSVMNSAFNAVLIVQELGHVIVKRVALVTLVQISSIFVLLTFFNGGVLQILSVLLLSSIFNFILVYFQSKRSFTFSLSTDFIKPIFSYSWPLVFHQLGGYLFNFSSVIILTNQLSLRDVALFSVLFKLASLNKICVNSINTAWQPTAFRKLRNNRESGKEFIKSSYSDFLMLFFILYLILTQALSFIVENWISNEYSSIIVLIPVMVGAYLFRLSYCFSTTLLFFDKKTHLIPVVTTIAGIINIILVSTLATTLSFDSAVYAFTCSMLFMSLFYAIYNKLYYKVSYFKELMTIISVITFSSYVNTNYSFITQNAIYSFLVLVFFLYLMKSGKINPKHIKEILKRS